MLELLLTAQLLAGERDFLIWPSHRELADWLSTGTVATSIALDTKDSWQSPDRLAAFRCESIRIGAAVGIAELTKRIVHRTRPDGSDDMSFFSEHTALAAASSSSPGFAIGLTIGTGYGRMAAGKHFGTDVLFGALVGSLTHLVCR